MTCPDCSPWAPPWSLCPYGHLLRQRAQDAHRLALAAPMDSPHWTVAAMAEAEYAAHVGVPWVAADVAEAVAA